MWEGPCTFWRPSNAEFPSTFTGKPPWRRGRSQRSEMNEKWKKDLKPAYKSVVITLAFKTPILSLEKDSVDLTSTLLTRWAPLMHIFGAWTVRVHRASYYRYWLPRGNFISYQFWLQLLLRSPHEPTRSELCRCRCHCLQPSSCLSLVVHSPLVSALLECFLCNVTTKYSALGVHLQSSSI